MADDRRREINEELAQAQEKVYAARTAIDTVRIEIGRSENDAETARNLFGHEIESFELAEQRAREGGELRETQRVREEVVRKKEELADRLTEIESVLGKKREKLIEAEAEQAARQAHVEEVEARLREIDEPDSEALRLRAQELNASLRRLEEGQGELSRRISEYAPLIEAQREATTSSGARELSEAYAAHAETHRNEWKKWLKALVVAGVIAAVGGVAVILLSHPASDATFNAQIASRLAIEVLVLGLLIYSVRFTAHQFSVHRHLETVAQAKAAALMTFNRIVAGPGEAEVRAGVAIALAQAVFDSGNTGFIDSGQENVTLVERVVGPVMQRVSQ